MMTRHEQRIKKMEIEAAIRTGKDNDVLNMLRAGYSEKEIANELQLDEFTVHKFVKCTYRS